MRSTSFLCLSMPLHSAAPHCNAFALCFFSLPFPGCFFSDLCSAPQCPGIAQFSYAFSKQCFPVLIYCSASQCHAHATSRYPIQCPGASAHPTVLPPPCFPVLCRGVALSAVRSFSSAAPPNAFPQQCDSFPQLCPSRRFLCADLLCFSSASPVSSLPQPGISGHLSAILRPRIFSPSPVLHRDGPGRARGPSWPRERGS